MKNQVAALASYADINDEQNIVIQLAKDGTIIRCNSAAEQYFLCDAQDVIGRCFFSEAKVRGWRLPFMLEENTALSLEEDNPELLFWRTLPLSDGYLVIGHHNHDLDSHSFSKLYFEKIIATVPHYIFWKDCESRYLGCNENFARFMGLSSPKDVLYKNDFDFFENDIAQELIDQDRKVLSGIAILDKEASYPNRPQTYRLSKVPLRNHKQEIIGIIGIYTDITARKKIEAQLLVAKDRAEEASRAKTEFIANISHDLRTSLNVIMGMSKLLRIRRHYLEQEELIDGVVEAAHSLMHQIDEILDYAKIEEGRLDATQTNFDLLEMIEDLVSLHAFEVGTKKIKFIVDYPVLVPSYFCSDPTSVKRLLGNLLGNATKFCESGYVKVGVRCVHKTTSQAMLKISVQDTGIGIEQDKIDSIFERFNRVDPSYKGRFKGTGLGLSIVSWLVQRLDGKIECQSELGVGTTFSVTLPFTIKLPSVPYRMPIPERFPRTLIVDDHAVCSEVLHDLVSDVGGACVSSLGAIDAMMDALKTKQPYQVIVVDDETHMISVADLIDQLRHLSLLKNCKLIFLSRMSYEMNAQETVVHHGYEKIAKPIRPSNFLSSIYDLWRSNQHQLEGDESSSVDRRPRVLLVEDEPLAQRYCTIMFEGLDFHLDVAGSGDETLSLLARHQYALILMDVGLPDISGIELTRKIRQNPMWKDVPIVALTAHVDNTKKQDCLSAGMSHFMNKPVSPNDLSVLLKHIFCETVSA